MTEKKISDGDAAESVVRRHIEARYGDKYRGISFRKAWYTPVGSSGSGLWDVEGTFEFKKGLLRKARRTFKYQVDAETGNIIGHEEFTPK